VPVEVVEAHGGLGCLPLLVVAVLALPARGPVQQGRPTRRVRWWSSVVRRSAAGSRSSLIVHGRDQAGWFELIVGKSVPTDGSAKCFGFVTSYDTKPKRRLAELLKAQGLQMNQAIMFLSDGGDNVRICSSTSVRSPSTFWTGFT